MSELYLARWRLNPRLRPVQQALADSQALHRLVMATFPHADGDAARQTFRVLYRLEVDEQTGVPTLLLQAEVRPDVTPVAPLLAPETVAEVKDVAPVYAAIAPGSVLRFRLRANPTKRIDTKRTHDRLAGKRVNLRTDEERQAWLARKLAEAGCQLAACTIREGFTQRGKRYDQDLRHGVVTFDGLLRVEDADALRASVRAGIGAGKAYGFGLLSLAPAE